MTDATYTSFDNELSAQEKNRAVIAFISAAALFCGAFLSGFVINEPSPHELYMFVLIAVWALLGLRIPAAIAPMILLLMLFNIGGVMTLMVTPNRGSFVIYVAVSFFLAFTAIFFASVISAKPTRLKAIFAGYLVAALVTGGLGILGYLGAIPNAEMFTRFGRAKGAFQDPNVFAPFLCLPAIYCLHNILSRPSKQLMLNTIMLLVLSFAIFLSFSRAGWGLFIFSSMALVSLLIIANPSGKFRIRVITLTFFAIATIAIALLIALQFDAVHDLFLNRAQLVQDYDGARLGRFARHIIGFRLAAENPLGIGILEFGEIFGEDPHNIYLKSATDYSWIGFLSYMILTFWTLASGFKILFRTRIWQPFLMCAYVVFVGHVLIGYVIDTDHWRHYFLLLGIIWGCVAAEAKHQRTMPQSGFPA